MVNNHKGEFGLPNYWNSHAPGNLPADVPEGSRYKGYHHSDLLSSDANGPSNLSSPGPFSIAVLSTFGNRTFLNAAVDTVHHTDLNL